MSRSRRRTARHAFFSATSADCEYKVVIEPSPWLKMIGLSSGDPEIETGGILVGRYSTDQSTAIISEATPPPPDSTRGRSRFFRGLLGLADLLKRRWREDVRRHYVGEWHYHPVAFVEPSEQDMNQMLDIGRATAYHCREPILVIIGRSTREQPDPPVRVFVCPSGEHTRELMVEATRR